MADFISREKEFRKLNEQLDDEFKRTTTLNRMEKINDSARSKKTPLISKGNESQRSNMMPNNDRFATYTKPKAQGSIWMKKSGGGDFVSPPKSPTLKIRKESYGNSFNNSLIKNFPMKTDTLMFMGNSRKQRKQPLSIEDPLRSTTTIVPFNHADVGARKSENSGEPITVQYRNQKFSASPSLDNMIKENLEKLEESLKEDINPDLNTYEETKNGGKSHVLESQNTQGKPVKKFVNTNGLIRFLKSKVALLEENQARTTQDMAQQKEAFESATERLKLMQQQRDKALLKNSALSEQLEKLTVQLNDTNRRFKEQSQESIAVHKELEALKREMKQLSLCHKSLEARHSRTKEELESALKSQTSLKNNERELKENVRRDTDAKDAEIKYLKKQRSDLFTAYKRQLYLIDNLRQQNICVEQAKMIDFCEKEFSKVLEWNLRP